MAPGSLSGRVALVTGASRGIGADVAKYLARAGAAVAVCARTEEQQNERLPGTIHSIAQEIANDGGRAIADLRRAGPPLEDRRADRARILAARIVVRHEHGIGKTRRDLAHHPVETETP